VKGHCHPGALEALRFEAVNVCQRKAALLMLGYDLAPVCPAKILENIKLSMQIQKLTTGRRNRK
jgi:hypothetical protein